MTLNRNSKQYLEIHDQMLFFEWLGEHVTSAGEMVPMPLVVVDQFNDMMRQFGKCGWWHYDGSRNAFINSLTHDLAGEDRVIPAPWIVEFLSDATSYGRDNPDPNHLRLHYLRPMVILLRKLLTDHMGYEFWNDNGATHLKSKRVMNRLLGVKIDVLIRENPPSLIPLS